MSNLQVWDSPINENYSPTNENQGMTLQPRWKNDDINHWWSMTGLHLWVDRVRHNIILAVAEIGFIIIRIMIRIIIIIIMIRIIIIRIMIRIIIIIIMIWIIIIMIIMFMMIIWKILSSIAIYPDQEKCYEIWKTQILRDFFWIIKQNWVRTFSLVFFQIFWSIFSNLAYCIVQRFWEFNREDKGIRWLKPGCGTVAWWNHLNICNL